MSGSGETPTLSSERNALLSSWTAASFMVARSASRRLGRISSTGRRRSRETARGTGGSPASSGRPGGRWCGFGSTLLGRQRGRRRGFDEPSVVSKRRGWPPGAGVGDWEPNLSGGTASVPGSLATPYRSRPLLEGDARGECCDVSRPVREDYELARALLGRFLGGWSNGGLRGYMQSARARPRDTRVA